MSIFSSILGKIFPKHEPAPAAPSVTAAIPSPRAPVDVENIVSGLASKKAEKLNWRTSIVDLLKVLDLDSSLSSRQELARELHYSGDMKDSAAMNIWLHAQVMKKLAENGGVVPADLRAAG